MKVVPQAFYQHPKIQKILMDGLSCIIQKSVTNADRQNQRYLSSHALTLVINGSLQIETFDGQLDIVHKNQLIFLPKGMYMISDIIPKDKTFDAIVFFFDEEVTDTFLTNFDSIDNVMHPSTLIMDYNEDLRLFTDTLLTLYKDKHLHQFTKPKLLEFLHLIGLTAQGDKFVQNLQAIKNREKKSVSTFMEEHYDKPLDIEDYAYLTGRSVSTFQRDFKRKFAISPKKWLIEKRLQKSAQLLKKNSYSVTDTMHQVGYENTSHFIKAFHKKFGISPKQFQIQHRKDILI
ncbi:MAG: AraC family transcriptional regulator [Bacteroidota bacterium]